MECNERCGVLGEEIAIPCPSQTDVVDCRAIQFFAHGWLHIPNPIAASWKNDQGCVLEDVKFNKDQILGLTSSGQILFEMVPWSSIEPQKCTWRYTNDAALEFHLAKSSCSLGSWPYLFQRIALQANPRTDETLQTILSYSKESFDQISDEVLELHLAQGKIIRDAFAQAVTEQLATMPSGPLGQVAVLFPQQGPHCLPYIYSCCHLPSVKKLINLARDITGIDLMYNPPIMAPVPLSQLNKRRNLLACFVAGLAALEKHRSTHGIDFLKRITVALGMGVGEYAAAVFSGVLSVQNALAAIAVHCSALQKDQTVVDSLHAVLGSFKVRPPRLTVYSSMDGLVYEGGTAVLGSLPFSVCDSPYMDAHRRNELKLALMQQGIVEIINLVPEDDDEKEEVSKESNDESDGTDCGQVMDEGKFEQENE